MSGATLKTTDRTPDSQALLQLATTLRRQGRFQDALSAIEKLLERDPQHANAWNIRGNLLLTLNRNAEAIASYDRALALNPEYPQARHNRGVALLGDGRNAEAEAEFRDVLSLKPNDKDSLFHLGVALAAQNRHAEALIPFDAAEHQGDTSAALFYCRAQSLLQLQRYSDALTDFDRAISIAGNDPAAWLGRGTALTHLNRIDEAIASFGECLRLRPDDKDALHNRAGTYARINRFAEAGRDASTLLRLDPEYAYALGLLLHARLYACDWRDLDDLRVQSEQAVKAGRRAIHPFLHLALSDSPVLNLRAAQIFASGMYPASPAPLWRGERYRHGKIRVAYLSADFYRHATAFLMAGVFEQHDRTRFETVAVSYGPDDNSDMRRRLEAGFDKFIDVRQSPDRAIAEKLREMEIDIAVDLKGYTGGAWPGILAERPAPVQAHYLGYPGSLGASYIDYLIADEIITPPAARDAFVESLVLLPGCYQCNDSKRTTSPYIPSRMEAGLPERAFVFCCFNTSFKITPEILEVWMRLLNTTPESVLWLLESHPLATANLRLEAQSRGIAPERLIFAKPVSVEDHLARLSLADLALDTFPYGAHTTASDAMWAGLPLVTMRGASFAARVAASILTTAGLTETITNSLAEYERCAAALARDRTTLAALRDRLKSNRSRSRLFDTVSFTRHLESAFATMYERHQRGLPPSTFVVLE